MHAPSITESVYQSQSEGQTHLLTFPTHRDLHARSPHAANRRPLKTEGVSGDMSLPDELVWGRKPPIKRVWWLNRTNFML